MINGRKAKKKQPESTSRLKRVIEGELFGAISYHENQVNRKLKNRKYTDNNICNSYPKFSCSCFGDKLTIKEFHSF